MLKKAAKTKLKFRGIIIKACEAINKAWGKIIMQGQLQYSKIRSFKILAAVAKQN